VDARAALIIFAACSGGGGVAADTSVESLGSNSVGTTSWTFTDATRARDLTVQAFYPTLAATADVAISELEPDPNRTTYAGLLATAPACPTQTLAVAVGADIAPGSFPVVLASHCHSCTRLSNATTAIRLASHGMIVLAVDHAGDLLWDHLAGSDAAIDGDELAVRAADVSATLDQLEAGSAVVAASADLAHIGVLGHSFGAPTAALAAQSDSRIASVAALCAPIVNPLTPGVTLADVTQPVLYIVAIEDNSITELGNQLIRENYGSAAGPAWKIEVPDMGHFSVSDLDGLVDIFSAGCGSGIRQTDGTPFTYLDPETARGVAASFATAFFRATLADDAGARAYLEGTASSVAVQAAHRD
jgi:dienelactone hydrolase